MIALLGVLVLVGLLGLLGSKTKSVTAVVGGYRLSVVYTAVTRPCLPVRWEYDVRHAGGFSGPIKILTTQAYLNLLDINSLEPQPSSETAGGGVIEWTFDPPSGDDFIVSIDAAAEAGMHELPSATAQVVIDGRPVVQVRFKTVVVP
jgi:hypothetical protein